jgi:RimJ/RimL family protein N-acetyltransferase
MLHSERFSIRVMQPHELSMVIDWAAAEGWNPGLQDADVFYQADPQGFFLGLLDGVPIAAASGVRYGDDYGFVGLLIVLPEFRDKTYGWRVGQAAMQHLAGRTVGIDGVVAHQPSYRRLGFTYAHRNVRYQGVVARQVNQPQGLATAGAVNFADIEAFDRCCFPAERPVFLRNWLQYPGGHALVRQHAGHVTGYALARPCTDGYKIGPLFADSPGDAEALLSGILAALPIGSNYYLDVPQTNLAAMALVEKQGMTMVFETARMYSGAMPELPISRIFGITTFELG